MKKHLPILFFIVIALGIGCQKELSFENGNTPAHGSLQSDVSGDCLPKTVNGIYAANSTLVSTNNTMSVQVNVTRSGSYTIYTDTVNGFYFRVSSIFTTLGTNNVTLRGYGTPFAAGVSNFVVFFDSSQCDVAVTVLPAGSGPATFTLVGTGGACSSSTVYGSYGVGVPLTGSDSVKLNVNVTAIGLWSVATTTVNGMSFSGTGQFTATGNQTITLVGTGTPTTAGSNTVPVTAGSSNCSFTVVVGGAALGTVSCGTAVVHGLYYSGFALTPDDSVVISVTVTTPGVYYIHTDTVAGVYFSASGTFPANGTFNLTLQGAGNPTSYGTKTYTVKFGTSTCTFNVNIMSGDYYPRTTGSNWSYEFNDVSTDSLLVNVISNTLSAYGNTYNIFMQNDGTTVDTSGYYRKSSGDYFQYLNWATIGFTNNDWEEYTILKDNVASGTSWFSAAFSNMIGTTAVQYKMKDSIDQKDVPITLTTSAGTTTYQNVIVIKEKFFLNVLGTYVDATSVFGYTKSYYARGIGLIQAEYYNAGNLTSTPDNWQKMRRYVVN
jgi:hypothetical protein